MKASELVKLIKQVVREEVNLALTENIKPLLKHIIKEQRVIKKSKKSNKSIKMIEALQVDNKQKPKNKNFVKDPILNDILNETANTEWKSMNGMHTSNLAQSMGMKSMDETFGGKPTVQQMIPQDRQGRQIPESLSKVLTRDYTDLVKAMDKRDKSK